MSPDPSTAPERTRLEPPVNAVSAPFWDATREERLLVQWCTACEAPIFYPREVCPRCLGTALEWRESAGTGVVHSASVQHRPSLPTLADRVPYVVALIDLDDGIRMMSNVVDCDPSEVALDMRVELCWERLSDGRNLPQFRPAGPSSGG